MWCRTEHVGKGCLGILIFGEVGSKTSTYLKVKQCQYCPIKRFPSLHISQPIHVWPQHFPTRICLLIIIVSETSLQPKTPQPNIGTVKRQPNKIQEGFLVSIFSIRRFPNILFQHAPNITNFAKLSKT